MEYIVIGVISLFVIFILKYLFDYDMKKIKKIGENETLDKIAKKYPSNIEMCREYLQKLKNENVKIEEDEESEASLYIALTNKILIGKIQNTYTRIQTIAHECLHSIQERKILLFNFIFSNIYFLYFIVIGILAILKMLPYPMLFISIFLVLSLIYYMVRVYLENDAMIKARYLAKEYLEEKAISSKEEINQLVEEFDKINKVGMKCLHYHFFMQIMMQTFILSTICLLRI